MNMIAIIGNVASEPEHRESAGGKSICTFRIAVSRPGGGEADFFTVSTWERQADVAKQYLTVGRRVGVEGRLHSSTWVDASDEQRRSKVEIVAHRLELLGGRPAPDEAT